MRENSIAKCGINRIIDANINRAKEGMRVCEEITRFLLEDHVLTSELKTIRHTIDTLAKKSFSQSALLRERESTHDIGKNIFIHELKRENIRDIFFANIQRVKESVRVLEEFYKLINVRSAKAFKKIRYDIYELEKKISKRLASLYHYR